MSDMEVYVYGMHLLSTIHQLTGNFPVPDSYKEISNSYIIPGGEGGNCDLVLKSLDVSVRLDGCLLGSKTEKELSEYYHYRGIDISKLKRKEGFEGWRDIVFCDGYTRTIFGWFTDYLSGKEKLWNTPCEESIKLAKVVSLDPYFGDESILAADLCIQNNKNYVTIDSGWDTLIAQKARAIVCSQQFLDWMYPKVGYMKVLKKYQEMCSGLIIFTFGDKDILYYSHEIDRFAVYSPFKVNVKDTLGAGDTFRAGVVYGVLRDMEDPEIVQFAAACAAVACTRFPSDYEAPALEEINHLISIRTEHLPFS